MEWIDVNDALPSIDEEVIVLTNHHQLGAYICLGHIVDKRIAQDFNGWNIPDVTHWIYCPTLPAMYKDLE